MQTHLCPLLYCCCQKPGLRYTAKPAAFDISRNRLCGLQPRSSARHPRMPRETTWSSRACPHFPAPMAQIPLPGPCAHEYGSAWHLAHATSLPTTHIRAACLIALSGLTFRSGVETYRATISYYGESAIIRKLTIPNIDAEKYEQSVGVLLHGVLLHGVLPHATCSLIPGSLFAGWNFPSIPPHSRRCLRACFILQGCDFMHF